MDGEPVEDPDRLVLLVVEVELHHLGVHVGRVPARIISSPHQVSKSIKSKSRVRLLSTNLMFTLLSLPLGLRRS